MTTLRPILVVGQSGQVARALADATWPGNLHPVCMGRPQLDLTNPASVKTAFEQNDYAAVINAAAYTQVDQAESEPEVAFAVNRDGPLFLAQACAQNKIPLIHISTDYVFDGTKHSPYTEDDPVNPINVYGASKAAGEEAIQSNLAEHVILRTSWIFSATGHNFLRTMLRIGKERDEIRIVDDQYGCPTAATDIADAITHILGAILEGRQDEYGTFHFTNTGATTWHGFACEIFRQATRRGFTPIPRLTPISTAEYPTPAKRPMNSVLNTGRIARVLALKPRQWEEALSGTLELMASNTTESPLLPLGEKLG